MPNILLFKATEIVSSLTQHRISQDFSFFFPTPLIKRCLVRITADGRGIWAADITLTGISRLSAVVYGGFAALSLRRQKRNTFSNTAPDLIHSLFFVYRPGQVRSFTCSIVINYEHANN